MGWYESGRGMTREVLKCQFLLYESEECPKKVGKTFGGKIALENDMLFWKKDPFADRCWWTSMSTS